MYWSASATERITSSCWMMAMVYRGPLGLRENHRDHRVRERTQRVLWLGLILVLLRGRGGDAEHNGRVPGHGASEVESWRCSSRGRGLASHFRTKATLRGQ